MKILYIAGRGHSGTTALDLALGYKSGFLSCGEISSGVGRHPFGICSCGKQTGQCSFWAPKLTNVTELKASLVKNTDKPYHLLTALLRKPNETYKNINLQIFQKLNTNGSIIIDSSKEMSRAIRFFKIFGPKDFYCIYLVRDPRSILNSYISRFQKFGTINLLRKKRKISSVLFLTILVSLGLIYGYGSLLILKSYLRDRCIIVDYDSLTSQKITSLSVKIQKSLNFDAKLAGLELSSTHPIAGNKILTEDKTLSFQTKKYQGGLKNWQLLMLSPITFVYGLVKSLAF